MKQILQQSPQSIMQLQKELITLRKSNEELKIIMKKIELKIQNDVMNEITEDGKVKYSNQLKRDIECEERLIVNADYLTAKNQFELQRNDIESKQIDLEFMQNQFSAMKALTRLFAGEE